MMNNSNTMDCFSIEMIHGVSTGLFGMRRKQFLKKILKEWLLHDCPMKMHQQ